MPISILWKQNLNRYIKDSKKIKNPSTPNIRAALQDNTGCSPKNFTGYKLIFLSLKQYDSEKIQVT